MHAVLKDLRFAIRPIRKNPGFTAVAVFTPALGIAANTPAFSLAHAVLLKPLPFRNPGRLEAVRTVDVRHNRKVSSSIRWPRYGTNSRRRDARCALVAGHG